MDGWVIGPLSTEVLVAAAENVAAQGEDGVGTADGPVHPQAFEGSDHRAAAGLHHAGADAQATQEGHGGLRTPPDLAHRLSPGAGQVRTSVIAAFLIEAPFHGPRRQLQGKLQQTGFQCLELDGAGSAGGSAKRASASEMAGTNACRRLIVRYSGEGPSLAKRASESRSLTAMSSPVSRSRRWHSSTSARRTWCGFRVPSRSAGCRLRQCWRGCWRVVVPGRGWCR